MSKAEHFMSRFSAIYDDLDYTSIDQVAKSINGIHYVTYIFEDGSKFTEGTNGYMNAETPF